MSERLAAQVYARVCELLETCPACAERAELVERGLKLTERQVEVLQYAADGHTAATTAALMYLSEATIKTHRLDCTRKLGVRSIAAAVAVAMRAGVVR